MSLFSHDKKCNIAMHSPNRYVVLALAARLAAAQTGCNTANYMSVNTTNGVVVGHAANSSACVVEYLGIPFAQPPVGDLRFAAPQALNTTGEYVAAEFGYDCPQSSTPPLNYPDFTPQAPQILSYFLSTAGTLRSEDCLTLNIWSSVTPNSDTGSKSVLIFMYGGRK